MINEPFICAFPDSYPLYASILTQNSCWNKLWFTEKFLHCFFFVLIFMQITILRISSSSQSLKFLKKKSPVATTNWQKKTTEFMLHLHTWLYSTVNNFSVQSCNQKGAATQIKALKNTFFCRHNNIKSFMQFKPAYWKNLGGWGQRTHKLRNSQMNLINHEEYKFWFKLDESVMIHVVLFPCI